MSQRERTSSLVRSYTLRIMAGIDSAEVATGALHALARGERLMGADVRETLDLAEDALEVAYDRVEDLRDVRGLSSNARRSVDTANRHLKEARSLIEQIERQVGETERVLPVDDAEQIREDVERLHARLTDARSAIDRVAASYDISTRLETDGSR